MQWNELEWRLLGAYVLRGVYDIGIVIVVALGAIVMFAIAARSLHLQPPQVSSTLTPKPLLALLATPFCLVRLAA